jgi:hypothetical protein
MTELHSYRSKNDPSSFWWIIWIVIEMPSCDMTLS